MGWLIDILHITPHFTPRETLLGTITVNDLTRTVVASTFVDKLRKTSLKKAIILGQEEASLFIEENLKKNKKLARSLKYVQKKNAKLALMENEKGDFQVFQVLNAVAKEKSGKQDDFLFGGVVFPSGEYIVYDETGNEHRDVLRS